MGQRILLVEDDARLAEMLSEYLRQAGLRVTVAPLGAAALEQLAAATHDAVVLDLTLPDIDGLDVCRRVRSRADTPVLMLSARGDAVDRIIGLELGADDYLAKPFEPRELVLRVRNILQRVPEPRLSANEIRFGACRLDLARGELYRGSDAVHLTAAETALLLALARRPGEPVSREALSEEAQFSGNVRTVDVQMTRLRRKIERDPKFPRYLQTVRGTGYVLKPD